METRPDFLARGQPRWCLEAALAAAAARYGAHADVQCAGGSDLTLVIPAERPAAAGDLVDVLLGCGRLDDAEKVLRRRDGGGAGRHELGSDRHRLSTIHVRKRH